MVIMLFQEQEDSADPLINILLWNLVCACVHIFRFTVSLECATFLNAVFTIVGISNVKSREDLVMSGSDSSDPFGNAPFKKSGKS